ncbi:MAG: helix-turn-helix domain-containing protein [Emergencia sp.]
MDTGRLRQLRTEKGYTQQDVKKATGIDQSDYSKIERGERYPTFQQAAALSFLYETSLDYIFGNTDDPRPHIRTLPPEEDQEKGSPENT